MSRTKRKDKFGEEYRDGKPLMHKCRCEWCMHPTHRDRYGLSAEECLGLNAEEE